MPRLPETWWADEMLGRLARYLRMTGQDTAYEPGLSDDEVLARARSEGRTLLTRDRHLSRRAPGSVLLTTVRIADQWTELRSRFPQLPVEPQFVRCTLCNGPLQLLKDRDPESSTDGPGARGGAPTDVFRCARCGHRYWEGSHTATVRRRLSSWSGA